ncbi:thioredoxin family protein [Luteibacter sp. NPDC031894]|uniref:thioredoxin family protein n=1 Tax=Luteibacter sp. NPDC031894 TaxID=3390572 RepID=UPI003CFEC966
MRNAMRGTDANFALEVLDSDVPVLVAFAAPWIGPWKLLEEVIEEVAHEWMGTLKVVVVNTDENPNVRAHFRITLTPTVCVFKYGTIRGKQVGDVSERAIDTLIQSALA